MAGQNDERTPGFNAPLADAGPIVSKRTGRRRDRVKGALGAPQKLRPSGRQRHAPADPLDEQPARGSLRGIAITLLILLVLGTRGCGLFANDSAPRTPTEPPPLVERITVPTSSTIVARGDGTGGD